MKTPNAFIQLDKSGTAVRRSAIMRYKDTSWLSSDGQVWQVTLYGTVGELGHVEAKSASHVNEIMNNIRKGA